MAISETTRKEIDKVVGQPGDGGGTAREPCSPAVISGDGGGANENASPPPAVAEKSFEPGQVGYQISLPPGRDEFGRFKRVGVKGGSRRTRPDNLPVSDLQKAFLNAWLVLGTRQKALAVIGISRAAVSLWRKKSNAFTEAYQEVELMLADVLDDELYDRALNGVKKPIIFQGKEMGHTREKDAATLIFALKGAKPDKYRENMVQLTSNAPTAIQINLGNVKKPEPLPKPEEG